MKRLSVTIPDDILEDLEELQSFKIFNQTELICRALRLQVRVEKEILKGHKVYIGPSQEGSKEVIIL